MTTQELIAFYQNLLPIQYKALPNAAGQVGVNVQQVIANQIYAQVRDAFDPQTAIGVQLDILGEYVGAVRTIAQYNPSLSYFELQSYAILPAGPIGFAAYADIADPVDYWLSYVTSLTTFVLTDGLMQQLIQYLIELHASDHTNEDIDLIFEQFFGQYVTLTDNADMTMTVTHSASTDPNAFFGIVKQLGLLPKPAGVLVAVVET